jgi:hypothetical protein
MEVLRKFVAFESIVAITNELAKDLAVANAPNVWLRDQLLAI